MASFTYALMQDGQIVEYRSYPQEMPVGQGAPGEFANMIAATSPPAPPIAPSPRAWLERLDPATQAAISAAAARDETGALLLWLLKAAGNPTIDITAPETIAGVQALAAAGMLTAAQQAVLLAP